MQRHDPAPGATFGGRYEILAKLGEGGFGTVHKARQLTTKQLVALKIMRLPEHGGAARADTRVARFLREAELCAQLHHPNIVQVVDSGQADDGSLYTVFAFAPGDTLADLLAREGALPPHEARHLMLQVLDALACAHAQGVVHRDLKPSNIMVIPTGARRNALVLDFGIGAMIEGTPGDGTARLTGSSDTLGTPGYGAPEQWRGLEPTPRADLFSWGLVFLECLLGRPAYGGTAAEIFYELLGPSPVPIPEAVDRHPFGEVLRRATQKDVAARDVTARGLLEALEACDLRALAREAFVDGLGGDASRPRTTEPNAAADDTSPPHPLAGDRRQLTALCCHLRAHAAASTERSPPDAEALDDVLRGAFARCAEVARRHGGHVAAALGDHLLVYFGYPRAAEDDARRAARAALAIVGAVASEGPPHAALDVGVGIHTGLVVAGEIRGLGTGSLVVGTTPRVAAALASAAQPGSVAVTGASHALLRGSFELAAEAACRFAGLSAPLDLFRLERERDAETPGPTPDGAKGPLVGRQQELDLLLDRWRRVRGGAGQLALVTGEPGIGKSRLARELRDRLTGASEAHAFVEGRCSPDTQNNALFPVVDLLVRALGLDQEAEAGGKVALLEAQLAGHGLTPAEAMPLFLPLFGLPLGAPYAQLDVSPQRQKALTLGAVMSLLVAMAEKQPLLLLVEDLHWADPTTLELLAQLVREVPSAPMCLLLTARPEFSPSFSTTGMLQLPLGRLERSQVEAMLGELTGHKALPASVVEQVASRTDGVPLFVEELTRMMMESGALVEREDRYELSGALSDVEMPGTLRALLTVRLDRLDRAKETAQVAAALGREFSVEVLAAVSPLGAAAVQEDLDKLMSAGLVLRKRRMRDPVGVFKHALVRDAAYESLSRGARQKVHARIAEALEANSPKWAAERPELLAHHYTEGGVVDRAIPHWQQAGQKALGQSASLEATQHFQRALDLVETLPESPMRAGQELGVRLPLASAVIATQGYAAPAVGAIFERAQDLCDQLGDLTQLFPVIWGLGAFHTVRAHLDTARDLSTRTLVIAEREHEAALLVPAHLLQGGSHMWRGELVVAREQFERALSYYRPEEHAALAALYSYDPGTASLSYLAMTLWFMGYPDQAAEKAQAAVTLTRATQHAHSYTHSLIRAAEIALLRGEASTALEGLDSVLKISEDKGFPMWHAAGIFFRGWGLCLEGQVERGLADMSEGARRTLDTGAEVMYPEYMAALAEAQRQSGQIDEALESITKAIEMAEKTKAGLFEAEVHRIHGELILCSTATAAGAANAEASLQRALEIARREKARSWEIRAAVSQARLWKAQGRSVSARELLSDVCPWFTEGFNDPYLKLANEMIKELA